MEINIVVAMADNRVIGIDNKLPWRLSDDLKTFRKITANKVVVMGRKTYESIGRPLPDRLNVVVSRNPDFQVPDDVALINDISTFLSTPENFISEHPLFSDIDKNQMMVIGGAEIFMAAIQHATIIYLTRVKAEIEGDAVFPEFNMNDWDETSNQHFSGGTEKNEHDFEITKLVRKQTIAA